MKEFIKKLPFVGSLAIKLARALRPKNRFIGSGRYWEARYSTGGNSGAGSYGRLALFKANVLNAFVEEKNIKSVIEFGCGDGHQLSLANYPSYTGLDVSVTAIKMCHVLFANDRAKRFFIYNASYRAKQFQYAELALSLDVIYNLVEDEVFKSYMHDLFKAAEKFVIIYASNAEGEQHHHEKMRSFTSWIDKSIKGWTLHHQIDNPYPYDLADPDNTSQADFYIYRRLS